MHIGWQTRRRMRNIMSKFWKRNYKIHSTQMKWYRLLKVSEVSCLRIAMISLNKIEWHAPLDNCFVKMTSKKVTVSAFKPPGHKNRSSRNLAMHVRATLIKFGKTNINCKNIKIFCFEQQAPTWKTSLTCESIRAIFSEQSGEPEALREASSNLYRAYKKF